LVFKQILDSHHCSQCDSLIFGFDHHNPLFMGCIGQKNKKPFILSLAYISFLLGLFFFELKNKIFLSLEEDEGLNNFLLFSFALLDLLVLFGFLVFLGFHLKLVSLGLTTFQYRKLSKTIQASQKNQANSSDYIFSFKNITAVFGSSPLLWLIPINNQNPNLQKKLITFSIQQRNPIAA
jgi:DHHC palmitoyltransferase